MDHGYWVVDSVLAASGRYKDYAAGWATGVKSAFMLAEYFEKEDGRDYVVIDAKGKVL